MLKISDEGLEVITGILREYEEVALKIYEGEAIVPGSGAEEVIDLYIEMQEYWETNPDPNLLSQKSLSIIWLKLDDVMPLDLEDPDIYDEWVHHIEAFDYIYGLISVKFKNQN